MRVLYLTDNLTLGGTIRILQSWLLLGRRSGLDGHVAVRPGSHLVRWLEANGVAHVANPMPWPDRRWPMPALWHAQRLARWGRRRGIDVIHCNEHNLYPFGVLLRRLLGRPLVCHVRYRLTREFCAWAFGGRGRQPDALLWTSRQQEADCTEAIRGIVPAERQRVLHIGLDPGVFGVRTGERDAMRRQWGFGGDEIVIGQACALRPRKRLEDFVELVARLAREDPRVVGVLAGDAVAGDEPYRELILRRVADSGLGPRFRWLGNLDDVEPFYQAIDVFVSTSEYETFGNSVCEAMCCSRPVVAYQGGSVQEVVGGAGLIARTGDLGALIAAARDCARDAGLRDRLGGVGRQRVARHFNPADSLDQLRQIYDALVLAGPGSAVA
jgi:glycosyltransferase involved in cell wall biosynthesis